jgi:hypothetical protein
VEFVLGGEERFVFGVGEVEFGGEGVLSEGVGIAEFVDVVGLEGVSVGLGVEVFWF